jgi:hypothetical protein
MARLFLTIAALFSMAAAPQPVTYSAGQVWSYNSRPQDAGSLIKIQQVEETPAGTIYHISYIGIQIRPGVMTVLQHAPVSQKTLDSSVTKQVADPGTFPEASAGIEEWRQARGGIFTITLSKIADIVSEMIAKQQSSPTD